MPSFLIEGNVTPKLCMFFRYANELVTFNVEYVSVNQKNADFNSGFPGFDFLSPHQS